MEKSSIKERKASRTYDSEGFVKRAACICVNEIETMVLLVSSRRNDCLWIVPGGGVEPDELPDKAAIREVREEAGVNGALGRCLGVFTNAERKHRTSVYVMVVTEELDEWEDSQLIGRKRKWFNIKDAVDQLAKHKPIQSSYVSLLLPEQSRSDSTSSSHIVCSTVPPISDQEGSQQILYDSCSPNKNISISDDSNKVDKNLCNDNSEDINYVVNLVDTGGGGNTTTMEQDVVKYSPIEDTQTYSPTGKNSLICDTNLSETNNESIEGKS